MLVLHLAPNGVGALDACFNGVLQSHLIKGLSDRCRKRVEELVSFFLGHGKLLGDPFVFLRMLKLKAEIL